MVAVSYIPFNQEEEGNELYYKQLGEVSQWLGFFLVQDFNLLKVQYKEERVEEVSPVI